MLYRYVKKIKKHVPPHTKKNATWNVADLYVLLSDISFWGSRNFQASPGTF
jgi:hypothetical protein